MTYGIKAMYEKVLINLKLLAMTRAQTKIGQVEIYPGEKLHTLTTYKNTVLYLILPIFFENVESINIWTNVLTEKLFVYIKTTIWIT